MSLVNRASRAEVATTQRAQDAKTPRAVEPEPRSAHDALTLRGWVAGALKSEVIQPLSWLMNRVNDLPSALSRRRSGTQTRGGETVMGGCGAAVALRLRYHSPQHIQVISMAGASENQAGQESLRSSAGQARQENQANQEEYD
jgi:hypothetical protein